MKRENNFKLQAAEYTADWGFAKILAVISATIIMFVFFTSLGELDKQSKAGEPASYIAKGLLKYYSDDYETNKDFNALDNEKFSTYGKPLVYDEARDVLHGKGERNIIFSVGNHGPSGYEKDYAWACMDASQKDISEEEKNQLELEFTNRFARETTGSTIEIIGKASSIFSGSSAAESASPSKLDDDGVVCIKNISGRG